MAEPASSTPRKTMRGFAAQRSCRQVPVTSSASVHHSVANTPRTPMAWTAGTLSAASLISASLKMKTTTAADIARMPRVLSTTLLAGHPQQEFPVLVADGRHREPRLAHQLHLLELGVRLDLGQRHRLLDRLDGLEVDRDRLAFLVGRVGIGGLDDLGDADDLLALAGMVEEGTIADFH